MWFEYMMLPAAAAAAAAGKNTQNLTPCLFYYNHHHLFIRSICFVLYMSMRIRSENATQETLAAEIGFELLTAQAVEMDDSSFARSVGKNYSSPSSVGGGGGTYEKVTTAEVV
jgi:hypothetical protein